MLHIVKLNWRPLTFNTFDKDLNLIVWDSPVYLQEVEIESHYPCFTWEWADSFCFPTSAPLLKEAEWECVTSPLSRFAL